MKIKSILALFALVLSLFGQCLADPLAVKLGPLTLQLPFQDLKAVSLYDFHAGRPLVGGETTLGDLWWFEFQGGAVTSLAGHGAPYLGADFSPSHPILSKILPANVNIGFFGGYDFSAPAPIYGLKATLGLW